jgi:BirA family biotin operon repressor/biotin-[acetyl-CoA-carboxylase] ligase
MEPIVELRFLNNSYEKTSLLRFFDPNPLRCFSLEQIASKSGLSYETIVNAIAQLNQEGIRILYRPENGYFYEPRETILHPDKITLHLFTRWWGRRVITVDQISSTIDLAKTLAIDPERHGTVCIANAQSKGRGRYGNAWASPQGKDILLTFLIVHEGWDIPVSLLSLYTVVSVVRVLDTAYGLPVAIKWPNDIVAEGRKLGGVLVERDESSNSFLISLGLNVHSRPCDWPREIRDVGVSLSMLKEDHWERDYLIAQCGATWETQWETLMQDKGETVRDYWNRYSTTLGKTVSFLYRGRQLSGFTKTIDQEGRLLLLTDEGRDLALLPEEVRSLRILE